MNHSALGSALTEVAILWTSLPHEAKSSVIWDAQSHRASSQVGLPLTDFLLPHRKMLRPINIDDIWPDPEPLMTLNCFLCWRFMTATADQTLKYKCTCVMPSHDLWCNRIEGISRFTRRNAVFSAQVQIYVFLLPKFSFKSWWMFNGNFKTLLEKYFWLNNTQ